MLGLRSMSEGKGGGTALNLTRAATARLRCGRMLKVAADIKIREINGSRASHARVFI